MTRRLRTDVHVGGVRYTVGTAEADLPDDVTITNPKAWEGDVEEAEQPEQTVIQVDPSGFSPTVTVDDSQWSGRVQPPPRLEGRGSARGKWAEFATRAGLDVDPDATKAEIVQACRAAGII